MTTENTKKTEEIDLGELLLRLYGFIRRNILIYGAAIIIGGIVGYLIPKTTAVTYSTKAIASIKSIDPNIAKSIIDQFSDFISLEKDYFDSNKETIGNISKLIAEVEYKDEKVSSGTQGDAFLNITVNTTIPVDREVLKNSIIDFFMQNPFIMEESEIFKRQSPELIRKYEEEIAKIELLQKESKTHKRNQQVVIENNSKSLNETIIQLFTAKQSIEKQVELFEPVRFVTDFGPFISSKTKGVKYAMMFAALLFAFTFFTTIIISLNRKMKAKNIK